MTYEFVPNEAGIEELRVQLTETVLLELANELVQDIKALIPEEPLPGTGTALPAPGLMRDSVKVAVVDGNVVVYSDEWRFHLVEFGFLHVGSEHIAGLHPFMRAVESWCTRHGFVLVPH